MRGKDLDTHMCTHLPLVHAKKNMVEFTYHTDLKMQVEISANFFSSEPTCKTWLISVINS